jgi:serine/threonine protein phosphatase PrpC
MNSIHNLLNHVVAQGQIYFNLAKERISNLTPLQQKVAAVALTVISGLTLMYIVCRCCCFKAKRVEGEETDLQLGKLNQNNQPNKTPGKPVSERLEANKKDAAEQQVNETAKGFKVEKEDAPTKVAGHDIHGEGKKVNGRAVGLASCQGRRTTMEDADIADSQSFTVNGKSYSFEVFGVFDGHSGADASAFVKKNISEYLKKALEKNNQTALTDEGIFKAIKESFIKLDADYKGYHGTTATAAIVLNGKIWVANVGDARTILVNKEGEATQASEDAKPSMDKYKKSIEKLGGYVENCFGIFRVNGILAVARAIGDKTILGKDDKTCCISPNPKITCYSLDDFKGGHLVMACDGLYDVSTTNEVGQAINEMVGRKESVESMSRKLVYHAIEKGSGDNVSAIVVQL